VRTICTARIWAPTAGFIASAFAEQTYTLDNGKIFKTRAAHIFRKRPDGPD
jgi:hypothetical protein